MARPKQVSDEELLEIAAKCFLENGAAVSTQIIADRVGLSQPALFKRFGTKEKLFLRALAPPERMPVLDRIDAGPAPGPFRPQLEEVLNEMLKTAEWIIPRMLVIQSANIAPETLFSRYKTPPPVQLLQAMQGFMERARTYGQVRADLDPAVAAQNVLGTIQGRAFFRHVSGTVPSIDNNSEYVSATTDLLCRGMVENEETQ